LPDLSTITGPSKVLNDSKVVWVVSKRAKFMVKVGIIETIGTFSVKIFIAEPASLRNIDTDNMGKISAWGER
jgi:hypothetical protein